MASGSSNDPLLSRSDERDINTTMSIYEQNTNAVRLHNFPRFGHTNQVSSIANEDLRDEYTGGLTALPIFLACFFVTWCIILLLLKFVGGIDRVGCAAGGEAVDVKLLRDIGFRRWQRRKIIRRNWRLQSIFAIAAIGVITFSFVFANRGLTPYLESLVDVSTISSLVQTRTRHTLHLGHLLSTHMSALQPFLDFNIATLCPNYEQTILESEYSLSGTSTEISYAAEQLNYFFDNDINPFMEGFDQIADTCKTIDELVESAEKNDWILRVILASVNVITLFLLVGVVLTRNKIQSYFYQDILAYVFVPAFVIALFFVVAVVCSTTPLGMVNADFCSGGDGNPVATLAELVTQTGYTRGDFLNKVVNYFAFDNCESPDPLLFLRELRVALIETSGRVQETSREIQHMNFAQLSQQCGGSFETVNTTLYNMDQPLSDVTLAIERLDDLATCEYVQPVLEDVLYGPICNETVDAVTWMFFSSLAIATLMMIMLSTRASLYNVLIPGPKKKRREKEYQQYKKFMEEYGFDTSDWVMDPPKKPGLVVNTETFDTSDSLSMIQVTPEPRDDPSDVPFKDEGDSVEEDRSQTSNYQSQITPDHDENSVEADEEESIISTDTDDSSLNPPPSVFSGVASSVSTTISSAVRKLRTWSHSKKGERSRDVEETESSPQQSEVLTPRKAPMNLLGMLEDSLRESEIDDSEILPLSPMPAEPRAPEKTRKSMRRTRGANDLVE